LRELRKLWNEYDPIGVVENSEIDDEYEAYVGPHLSLLEGGASDEAIFDHINEKSDRSHWDDMVPVFGGKNKGLRQFESSLVSKEVDWHAVALIEKRLVRVTFNI
jgi:hypothetical protein